MESLYSGTAEGINREIFRDINKMANIFEVHWLVLKCFEYFSCLVNSVTSGIYEELLFLFEEACFVYENLKKNMDFITLVNLKIETLKWKEQFLEKYLENADRLSTKKLDLVIALADDDVNYIVQPLVKQLRELFKVHGPSLPVSFEYLFDNIELHICLETNGILFKELFDLLRELPNNKLRWTLDLLRQSTERMISQKQTSCAIDKMSSNPSSSQN